jgi:hypothetical protein
MHSMAIAANDVVKVALSWSVFQHLEASEPHLCIRGKIFDNLGYNKLESESDINFILTNKFYILTTTLTTVVVNLTVRLRRRDLISPVSMTLILSPHLSHRGSF